MHTALIIATIYLVIGIALWLYAIYCAYKDDNSYDAKEIMKGFWFIPLLTPFMIYFLIEELIGHRKQKSSEPILPQKYAISIGETYCVMKQDHALYKICIKIVDIDQFNLAFVVIDKFGALSNVDTFTYRMPHNVIIPFLQLYTPLVKIIPVSIYDTLTEILEQ